MTRGWLICGWLAFAIAPVRGQTAELRGTLLEYDSGVAAGEFAIRGPDSEVFRFRFDALTKVERASMPSSLTMLRSGETVEVKSDAIAGSPLRYASSIRAVEAIAPPRIVRPAMKLTAGPSGFPLPSDPLFPRGDLTFSGVVGFFDGSRLILRTRAGQEQIILLRRDTRYLASGGIAHSTDVKANMRVFVRAGKDLFGHTEAYQVMWGGFLEPRD